MGKMFFNILATFAEFEVDLLRMRTREGMAVARAKGKLRGRQPKLSTAQQAHLVKLHGSGEHSIANWPSCSRCPDPRCTECSSALSERELGAWHRQGRLTQRQGIFTLRA